MLVVWEQTNAYYLLLYFKRKTFGSKRGQRYRFESYKEHYLPEWWNGRRGCLKSSYPFGCVGSSPTLGTIKVGVLTLCLATNKDAHRTRFFSTEIRKLKREASKDWLQTVFGITIWGCSSVWESV